MPAKYSKQKYVERINMLNAMILQAKFLLQTLPVWFFEVKQPSAMLESATASSSFLLDKLVVVDDNLYT